MVTLGQAAPQGAALQPQGILQTLLGGLGRGEGSASPGAAGLEQVPAEERAQQPGKGG